MPISLLWCEWEQIMLLLAGWPIPSLLTDWYDPQEGTLYFQVLWSQFPLYGRCIIFKQFYNRDFYTSYLPQRTWDKGHYRQCDVKSICWLEMMVKKMLKTNAMTSYSVSYLSYYLGHHPFSTCVWRFYITFILSIRTVTQTFCTVLDFSQLDFKNKFMLLKDWGLHYR